MFRFTSRNTPSCAAAQRGHATRPAPRYRPALELLEDRCLLSVGTFDPATGLWYLRSGSSPGAPNSAPFAYGAPGWSPVNGDWNGDGTSSIGVFDPATATWYLRNSNTPGAPDVTPFQYGAPGWIPVVGDWDGNGTTTIGVVDPSTNTWYLRNSNGPGAPDDAAFQYGAPGWLPVAGDWTGSGPTGIGAFDPNAATWYLRNSTSSGAPDVAPFAYGGPGWLPAVGDWDNNGTATVGVVDPSTETWYLKNANQAGPPDVAPFAYGAPGWALAAVNQPLPQASTSQFISAAQGGTLTLADGSNVSIPAGALPKDETVTLSLFGALPRVTPSQLIRSVGHALVLSLEPTSSQKASAPVKAASAGKTVDFHLNQGSNPSSDLQGSAPMADVVDLSGSENFIGIPGSTTSNTASMSLAPQFLGNTRRVVLSQSQLSRVAQAAPPPPPLPSGQLWDNTTKAFVAIPPTYNPNKADGSPKKELVVVHGMLSTATGAWGQAAPQMLAREGYDEIIAYNYNWPQGVEQSGTGLASFLNVLHNDLKIGRVDIDAHSEGGPVSLFGFAQTAMPVDNLVLLASPVTGTPAANVGIDLQIGRLLVLQTVLSYFPAATPFLGALVGLPLPGNASLQSVLNGQFAPDLVPNSATLARGVAAVKAKLDGQTTKTKLFVASGDVSLLPPSINQLIYGTTPNDTMVPVPSTKGAGTGLPFVDLGTVHDSHTHLTENQQIMDAMAKNLAPPPSPPPSLPPSPPLPPPAQASVAISSAHATVLHEYSFDPNLFNVQVVATGTVTAPDPARLVPFNYISGSTLSAPGWSVDQHLFEADRAAGNPVSTTWTYTSAPFDVSYSQGHPQAAAYVVDLFSLDTGALLAEDRRALS